MQPTNNHRGLIIIAVIVAIVGYLIGLGIINTINKKPAIQANSKPVQNSSGLKSQAGGLAQKNGALILAVATAAIDTPQNFDKQSKELMKNTEALGTTIGEAYGESAKTTFTKMWESHLSSLINYAVAVKNNDAKTVLKASTDLDTFEVNFANYLNSLNPKLSSVAINRKVKEYIDPLKAAISAHVNGNKSLEAEKQNESNQASQVLFNIITSSIAQQFPDKYK